MFLIVYCALAIAVFFWMFGFTTVATVIGLLTLALLGYSFIRRQIEHRRFLKQHPTNKSRG